MKHLVLGDIHLLDKYPNFLVAQLTFLVRLIKKAKEEHKISSCIFLGDIFEHRSPKPRELIVFHRLINHMKEMNVNPVVIRGNHDAVNRMDTDETVLSVFADNDILLFDRPGIYRGRYGMVPHYESSDTLRTCYNSIGSRAWVFGHFGYRGCIPYVGDDVFTFDPEEFQNNVCLGHIHTHQDYINEFGSRVLLLGTPYGTCFQEAGHTHYYGILDEETDGISTHEITFGPRFYVVRDEDVDQVKEDLKSDDWFTYLRIMTKDLSLTSDSTAKESLKNQLNVEYLEIRYIPTINHKAESYNYEDQVISLLDESLITQYIETTESDIDKGILKASFLEIKNEHQKNND